MSTPRDVRPAPPWWFEWWVLRLLLVVIVVVSREVPTDVAYYEVSLREAATAGWSAVLPEYPLPMAIAIWPLVLAPWLHVPSWVMLAAGLLVLDAFFARGLERRVGRAAARYWSWGLLMVGPLAFLRIDLVAAVLLGWSTLAVGQVAVGALLAAGVAAKIFPLAGLPAALICAPRPRRVVAAMATTSGLLAAVTLTIGGWARLISPLTYQSDRGLQIESVAATPFHLLRAADPERWHVAYAASRSWEIAGPGTALAAHVAVGAQVALMAAVGWLIVSVRRRVSTARKRSVDHRGLDHRQLAALLAWTTIAPVCGLIATSKAFSPQYVLWVLPLVAITLGARTRASTAWAGTFLVVSLLTQAVYPMLYDGLLDPDHVAWVAVAALTVRNVLFVALTASAFGLVLRAARQLGAADSSRRLDVEAARRVDRADQA